MKYMLLKCSGAMSILSFITMGSGFQKQIEEDSQAHGQHVDLISLLLYFSK
jgi:hypothetical protein